MSRVEEVAALTHIRKDPFMEPISVIAKKGLDVASSLYGQFLTFLRHDPLYTLGVTVFYEDTDTPLSIALIRVNVDDESKDPQKSKTLVRPFWSRGGDILIGRLTSLSISVEDEIRLFLEKIQKGELEAVDSVDSPSQTMAMRENIKLALDVCKKTDEGNSTDWVETYIQRLFFQALGVPREKLREVVHELASR